MHGASVTGGSDLSFRGGEERKGEESIRRDRRAPFPTLCAGYWGRGARQRAGAEGPYGVT
jgi:hypothetical protein